MLYSHAVSCAVVLCVITPFVKHDSSCCTMHLPWTCFKLLPLLPTFIIMLYILCVYGHWFPMCLMTTTIIIVITKINTTVITVIVMIMIAIPHDNWCRVQWANGSLCACHGQWHLPAQAAPTSASPVARRSHEARQTWGSQALAHRVCALLLATTAYPTGIAVALLFAFWTLLE